MSETATTKACVACGKNLNGQPRMKDSQGRYWCMECGQEDKRKKAFGVAGHACTACGQSFPDHELSKFGNQRLCTACVKRRNKKPGLMTKVSGILSGGGQADRGKIYKMLAIVAVLIVIAIWRYATL